MELVGPFDEKQIRALRAGDAVSISGRVFTGRDRLHKYFAEGGTLPFDLREGALFHCGPVVVSENGAWRVVAAGPTTSVREEPYEADLIRRTGLRVIIGKGGMGAKTRAACRECGCVYLQAVGGAAAAIARCVKRVCGVYFLEEFGATEAVWELELVGLRAVVGIDAQGGDLFEAVRERSAAEFRRLIGREDDANCVHGIV